MTTTLPPHTPGLSRTIPERGGPQMPEAVRELLSQTEGWVRRPDWSRFLRTGDAQLMQPTGELTRDQFVAIHAWFRQQRHALYRALEGGVIAPDGWIEKQPLYDFIRQRAHLDY